MSLKQTVGEVVHLGTSAPEYGAARVGSDQMSRERLPLDQEVSMSGEVALPGPAQMPDWYLAFGCADGRLKVAAGIQLGELRVRYERALGAAGTAEAVGLLIAAVLLAGFAIRALLA